MQVPFRQHISRGESLWLHPQCQFTVGLQARNFIPRVIENTDLDITIGYDLVKYRRRLCNRGRDKKIIKSDFVPAEVDVAFRPTADIATDIGASPESLSGALPDG